MAASSLLDGYSTMSPDDTKKFVAHYRGLLSSSVAEREIALKVLINMCLEEPARAAIYKVGLVPIIKMLEEDNEVGSVVPFCYLTFRCC